MTAWRFRFTLSLLILAVALPSHSAESGLAGRLIVGYQGWFGCPNDYLDNKDWHHWFAGTAAPESLTVDLLPSLAEFKTEDLCDTGLKRADGSTLRVFSSQNANIVATHFEWMKAHDIDGVAFQRFITHTRIPHLRNRSDNVLAHVRKSAERHDRVFYVTYDVSGADPDTVTDDIRRDWKYLAEQLGTKESPAYLKHGGLPLVQLWGFGFKGHPGTAEQSGALIADLKNGHAGLPAATVIGGVPAGWRTLTGDSKTEPEWARVYRSYQVISPWSVGRFSDEAGADRFRQNYIEPDMQEVRKLGLTYMPVVFPGFSWHNLMTRRGQPAKAIVNQIPRRCGRFMWRQIVNALEARAETLYGAMFDEVDEGTALFNLESSSAAAPAGVTLASLDADGCALPEDGYLRISGKAALLLRSGATPARTYEQGR